MKMKDFTTYDLPLWLNAAVEELERRCIAELKEENLFYKEVLEETSKLLNQHRFISTLADKDPITEPMNLSLEETKALSRFLALEGDRRDMENIQSYLLGCRHALEILVLLKMI